MRLSGALLTGVALWRKRNGVWQAVTEVTRFPAERPVSAAAE
jgi:hypothetical protein